jgi:activator of HSP90 ATPase
VIQQRVRFRTSPQALFDLYLDSPRHALSTGAPATISRKVGGAFKAFEGQLEGKNMLIIPGRQIVQLWRATHWRKADWSLLILTFSPVAGGAKSISSTLAFPRTNTRVSAKAVRNTIGARERNTSANPPRSKRKNSAR